MALDKLWNLLSLKTFLIVLMIVSVLGMVLFLGQAQVTGSQMAYAPALFCGGFALVLLYIYRMAGPLLANTTIQNRWIDRDEVIAYIFPDVTGFFFAPDHVMWKVVNSDKIQGAKVLQVTDVTSTWRDVSMNELRRRLKAYEDTMGSGAMRVGTFHMRLPIDVEAYRSALIRRRDWKQSDFDSGGMRRKLEDAEKMSTAIARMEKEGEKPYDARFFIFVADEADNQEDLESILEVHAKQVLNMFDSGLGIKAKVLRDMEVPYALSFFRAQALVGRSAGPVASVGRPVRVMSYDLVFQNPFVTRKMPPLERLLTGIYLGTMRDTAIPVSWNPEIQVSLHGLVLGTAGAGKSTLAKTMMIRARRDLHVPVWVINPAGKYVEPAKSLGADSVIIDFSRADGDRVNPFILYGRDPTSVATSMSEMLTYISGLYGPERALVDKVIRECYAACGISMDDKDTWRDDLSNYVTMESVYQYLQANVDKLPLDERPYAKSVIGKIARVSIGAYKMGRATFSLDELWKKQVPVVFNLKDLETYMQRAIVWSILTQLYALAYIRYQISEKFNLMFIVDEAHLFAKPVEADVPGGYIEPPLSMFMRMMRKRGVGLWLLSHIPGDFVPPGESTSIIFQVAGTVFLFGSTEDSYLRFCAGALHLSEDELKVMLWMGRGEGMLRYYGDPRAIAIKVMPEESALAKGSEKDLRPPTENSSPPGQADGKRATQAEKPTSTLRDSLKGFLAP